MDCGRDAWPRQGRFWHLHRAVFSTEVVFSSGWLYICIPVVPNKSVSLRSTLKCCTPTWQKQGDWLIALSVAGCVTEFSIAALFLVTAKWPTAAMICCLHWVFCCVWLHICIPGGAHQAARHFEAQSDATNQPGYSRATGSSPCLRLAA